jgi:hypothetical protein
VASLDSAADLQRLKLERFHCACVRTYVRDSGISYQQCSGCSSCAFVWHWPEFQHSVYPIEYLWLLVISLYGLLHMERMHLIQTYGDAYLLIWGMEVCSMK